MCLPRSKTKIGILEQKNIMGSFKEMVRQKRVKVLILVVFLCLAFCYIKGDIPDVKYFGSRNLSVCVINGDARNSGIGWIYPDYYEVETESFFYPNINNSFSTNFVKSLPSEWAIDGWYLSNGTPLDVILDTRWESVETLKSNQEFKHTNDASIHLTSFPLAFSILATKNVEILLSEGWNPGEFASYYIVIGGNDAKQVLFKRIKSYNGNIAYNDLEQVYKSDLNILSNEAWKTFYLDFDAKTGILELSHVVDNKFVTLLKSDDEKPLKPIFFLTRNLEGTARWKLFNRKYLYTNQSGEFKFGPELRTPSVEICVSVYVALCDDCKIDFYIYNNSKKEYLSQAVHSTNFHGRKIWREVKLIKTNNQNDTAQIFISTYTTNTSSNNSAGKFWAVDEVRVCTRDEIKISQIKSSKYTLDDPTVTCQSLRYEKWRPKRVKITPLSGKEELTVKKVTTTSITLKLSADILSNIYTYAYKALAAKDCPPSYSSYPRNKSNGYVTTAENEIFLGGLIPYTFYEIRVTEPIRGWTRMIVVLTSETELPTKEELPQNIKIKPTNVSVIISWDKLNCTRQFGKLIYQINVTKKETHFVKTHIVIINSTNPYTISELKSFTNYSLDLLTARDEKYFTQNGGLLRKATYNFTTLPGVAPKVKNLEVYSTDSKLIELRYQLPNETNGIPVEANIRYCLYDYVCQNKSTIIEKCRLWKDYYCIRLSNLRDFKEYIISIRLRNNGTTDYGNYVKIETITEIKAPGKPTDLSYKMLNCNLEEDYCHLEIKWKHPFSQISTIEKFELTLNETVHNDESVLIKEMYRVDKYYPVYTHIVRYIPYSTIFNISVRSSNLYFNGEYSSIIANTDHLGKHIDQLPKLFSKTGTNVTFKVPTKDFRLQSLILITIVQDNDHMKNATLDFYNLTDALCQNYGETWIASVTEVADQNLYFITIGDGEKKYSSITNNTIHNKPLSAHGVYCVSFIIRNLHQNKTHTVVYFEKDLKLAGFTYHIVQSGASTVLVVFIVGLTLGLIGVMSWFIFRYIKQQRFSNLRQDDHVYVSLESLPNAVTNSTYDKLIQD